MFIIKEPEKLINATNLPNVFLTFGIESCPKDITVSGYIDDTRYVNALGASCNLVQDLIATESKLHLQSLPQKTINIVESVLDVLSIGVMDIFKAVDILTPRKNDGNTQYLYFVLRVICQTPDGLRDRYLLIKFTNFHIGDVHKLGPIFQELCENVVTNKQIYMGPETEANKLDNACNRISFTLASILEHLITKSRRVFYG